MSIVAKRNPEAERAGAEGFNYGEVMGARAERDRIRALVNANVRHAHGVSILPSHIIDELVSGERSEPEHQDLTLPAIGSDASAAIQRFVKLCEDAHGVDANAVGATLEMMASWNDGLERAAGLGAGFALTKKQALFVLDVLTALGIGTKLPKEGSER